MLGLQNMGTPNTCGGFKSRFPLQIKNSEGQESNKPAVEAESPTPDDELDELDDELDELDDLEKLEANFQVAKKASAKVTADMTAKLKA